MLFVTLSLLIVISESIDINGGTVGNSNNNTSEEKVKVAVAKEKDIDGFNPLNTGNWWIYVLSSKRCKIT